MNFSSLPIFIKNIYLLTLDSKVKNSKSIFLFFESRLQKFPRPPWRPSNILSPLNYSLSRSSTTTFPLENCAQRSKKRRAFFPRFSSVLFSLSLPFSLSWHDIESRPNNRGFEPILTIEKEVEESGAVPNRPRLGPRHSLFFQE